MNYRVIRPEGVDPSVAVVIPNHLASSHEDDLGIKAIAIAEELGITAVAYDRPGTGQDSIKHTVALGLQHQFRPLRRAELAAQTASSLDKVLFNEGITDVILSGSSVAANGAAAIARSEKMRFDALALMDPIFNVSVLHWTQYQLERSEILSKIFDKVIMLGGKALSRYLTTTVESEDLAEIVDKVVTLGDKTLTAEIPARAEPAGFMREHPVQWSLRATKEFMAYHEQYNSVAEDLEYVAKIRPTLPIIVAFAEHGFTETLARREAWARAIETTYRTPRHVHTETIRAYVIPGSKHETFDDPQVYADVVRGVLRPALNYRAVDGAKQQSQHDDHSITRQEL